MVKIRKNKRYYLPKRPTKLRRYMDDNGLSPTDVYNKIKQMYPDAAISKSTIIRIELGQDNNYTIFTLYRIMNALKLTPNDILDWELQWRQE